MSGPYIHTFSHRCRACSYALSDGVDPAFILAQHRLQLWEALADELQRRAGMMLVDHVLGTGVFELSDCIAMAKKAARARRRTHEASLGLNFSRGPACDG